jgi:hypothetical protein
MSGGAGELESLIFDHLCDEHPESVAGLKDSEIKSRIRAGIIRARSHGLDTDGSATAFVSLMFLVAPDFDRQPAIRRALTSKDQPPDDRIKTLFASTSEDDWAEAASRSSGWEGIG